MYQYSYKVSAKFMATHILTWFSNRNQEINKFIAAAYSQMTCKSIHLLMSEGTRVENEGRPFSGYDGRSNHNRGWFLASTHSAAFRIRMHSYPKHGRFDGWRTAQRRISSRQRTSNWAACHLPWGSEGVDIFRPSFVHAWVWAHGASASVGEGLGVLLNYAAHWSLADSSLCGQLGHRTTGIRAQLFSRVLTIHLVRTVLFLPWPGRLDVWPVSLNFLTTFQTVSHRIWSSFAMVELLSPFLWRLAIVSRSIAIEIMLFI